MKKDLLLVDNTRSLKIFTAAQEAEILQMVLRNSNIRLRTVQTAIIANQTNFYNTDSIRIFTTDRVSKCHNISMKQILKCPLIRTVSR